MMSYTLIIVVLPILMFLVLGLGGNKMKPVVAGVLGCEFVCYDFGFVLYGLPVLFSDW